MPPLPSPVRIAVTADLALNAIAAVVGPEHVMLVQQPIAQFGVLVAAGLILHEVVTTAGHAAEAVRRWWRRRQ